MNFFEHQDRARSTTRKLVLLFMLAVASLIIVTTFLVVAVFTVADSSQDLSPGQMATVQSIPDAGIFLAISAIVIAVVLLGAMFRMAQLRGGGRVVAEALGGRLLNLDTRDADERKILNVVEEMAIACGLSVPPVYLLEDAGINAFAAGYKKEDAVIGITRGCISLLDRDELQGVIAHEFSHIFNGDMRLNIRLIGWLYGIMVIGMIGYFILRSNTYRMAGRGGKNNKGGIIFLALGLVVIGYGGTFFGNLIKAAVSRQREFLADASAVQFTRNPEGIAGALKKIAMSTDGSLLVSTDVSEVSHMLFGQGIKAGFTGLFATHPPLTDRIKRIQPRWDGNFESRQPSKPESGSAEQARHSSAAGAGLPPLAVSVLAAQIVASIGEPSSASLALASSQLAALPANLREESHSLLGAGLLMYCLVISGTHQVLHETQLEQLRVALNPASFATVLRMLEQVNDLPRELHLVLLDLALPSLKQLSAAQVAEFMKLLQGLMDADQELSLFEWCLSRIVQQHLAPTTDSTKDSVELDKCGDACEILLSALAQAGHESVTDMEEAMQTAVTALGLQASIKLRTQAITSAELDQAMSQLLAVKPLQKPRLLKAMVASMAQDGKFQPAEIELLRAAGAILDCPVPPLKLD